ncbi:hypothetical protein J3P71_20900 [Rhizobium leguminosarum]|uniref:hypothetical protein n=1 Tax=Rhizobium leguminosarum TaxID=384 RepID=UPI0014426437|nr:hypothetical protein [Rhizobium leguminosarum]MBY5841306.1 hypothetical protein [Rhizobium leguminosarum]NKM80935.1 hypothetical protein [Rhizobium leguminosarum bv. viciae]QSZ07289.1 hypothetical protein J3P71_20900 [Rhizobium leguminosarum]
MEHLTLERPEELWDARIAVVAVDFSKQGLSKSFAAVVQLFNPDTILIEGFFPKSVLQALLEQVDLTSLNVG